MGKNMERGPLPLWCKWVRTAEGLAKQTKTNKLTVRLHSPQAKSSKSSLLEKSENSPKDTNTIQTYLSPWPDKWFHTPAAQRLNIRLQCRRRRFDPWVRKILWRKWQPTPVFLLGTPIFLPGKSHSARGAWRVTVHRVAKSRTWLSN